MGNPGLYYYPGNRKYLTLQIFFNPENCLAVKTNFFRVWLKMEDGGGSEKETLILVGATYFQNYLIQGVGGGAIIISHKIDHFNGLCKFCFYRGLDMYLMAGIQQMRPLASKVMNFVKNWRHLNFAIWKKVFSNFVGLPQLNRDI